VPLPVNVKAISMWLASHLIQLKALESVEQTSWTVSGPESALSRATESENCAKVSEKLLPRLMK
jgi:hypothetical protein